MMVSMGANLNPIFGITSIPNMGFHLLHSFPMNAREVLAANFKKLRGATPSLSDSKALVKIGAGTNGTIERVAKASTGATIDTIEKLAAAYGLSAWQILAPTLEAKPSVGGRPVVTGVSVWPFADIDPSRFDALTLRQQIEIQGVVRERIERFEADSGKIRKANGTTG